MSAVILDGTKIAAQIRAEVGEEVKQLAAEGLRPGLAVVLVGHNPASEIYVRGKMKASEELGILSEKLTPPEMVTTWQLAEKVIELYWPHCAPYGEQGAVLRQNRQGKQAEIVARIVRFREQLDAGHGALLPLAAATTCPATRYNRLSYA